MPETSLPGSVPTILVCPLPIPGLPHEQLLPELSHELKTPLTGIMGLAQVLQRYPIADREHQYAELIYQKSQQLLVSIHDLFDLSWPHQSSGSCTSAMPGRSGAVLKFLLAKQLAQLHGGDVSWTIRSSLETEVTVLLPRDLTRATVLTQPGLSNAMFLTYAQPNAGTDDVVQMLRSQGVLVAIGRSLDEIQEKVKILSPVVLVLDSCCVEAPECALLALLTGPSTQTPVHVVWLNTAPIHEIHNSINVLDVWPLPLTADHIAQTLRQIRQNAEGVSPP